MTRPRWLLLASTCVAAGTAAIVDAIELRLNGSQSYWRNEWGEIGHTADRFAVAVYWGGSVLAGAQLALAIVLATRRGSGWRVAAWIAAVPVACVVAFGVAVAIRVSPWIWYSDRTS